jgi:hypothetical protein
MEFGYVNLNNKIFDICVDKRKYSKIFILPSNKIFNIFNLLFVDLFYLPHYLAMQLCGD